MQPASLGPTARRFRTLFFVLALSPYAGVVHAQLSNTPNSIYLIAGGTQGTSDGTGPAAQFSNSSYGISANPDGNLYVVDTESDTIRKITPAGVVSTLAGMAGVEGSADGTGAAARFFIPIFSAADAAGNLYIADQLNHTIRKVTTAGVVSTVAGMAGVSGSADGTGTAALFRFPTGIAVDASGNLYVSDSGSYTIRKITPAGLVSTLAGMAGVTGSADGVGGAARFNVPLAVTADPAGNLYVSDTLNRTIRKITPAGLVSTLAGTPGLAGSDDGTGPAARFQEPLGIALDSAGNVYVADDQRIRKITPGGAVTSVAGSGVIGNFPGAIRGVTVISTDKLAVTTAGFSIIGVNFDGGFQYDFTGFAQPVDNPPTVNTVRAGSAVPLKFSLAGDKGLAVLAPGFPRSQTVLCSTTAPVAAITETVSAGGSSLTYDALADRYTYVWKTDKAWADTCRQLTVRLSDGSDHTALFRFGQ